MILDSRLTNLDFRFKIPQLRYDKQSFNNNTNIKSKI